MCMCYLTDNQVESEWLTIIWISHSRQKNREETTFPNNLNLLTCNHLYGHKRTWSVFCDRRSHRVWAPEYNDTQDRDYSHSFQNPGTERERRQESLRKNGRIIFELTCNRLPDHKKILWADQSHLVPLLPNICIHYRPFLRIIHNPESDQTFSRKWYPTKSNHARLFKLILNGISFVAIVPYFLNHIILKST